MGEFWRRHAASIPVEHQTLLASSGNELKWQNMIRWSRRTLIDRGWLESPARGTWRISDAGRAHLAQANNSVPLPMAPLRALDPAPSSDRTYTLSIEGRSITLSVEDVLAAARRAIAQGLPPAARNFQSWAVEIGGQQVGVKWLFGLVTGMPHADFKLSHARRSFENLGLAVRRIEPEVSRTEHPGLAADTNRLTQAHVILDGQFATVQDFLNGRAGRPSDERLCDWVHLCYEFELYCEGRDVFGLIDPSQVNAWYYERAKRLAKVCAMKAAGQA